jgi:hypothetical protein
MFFFFTNVIQKRSLWWFKFTNYINPLSYVYYTWNGFLEEILMSTIFFCVLCILDTLNGVSKCFDRKAHISFTAYICLQVKCQSDEQVRIHFCLTQSDMRTTLFKGQSQVCLILSESFYRLSWNFILIITSLWILMCFSYFLGSKSTVTCNHWVPWQVMIFRRNVSPPSSG